MKAMMNLSKNDKDFTEKTIVNVISTFLIIAFCCILSAVVIIEIWVRNF